MVGQHRQVWCPRCDEVQRARAGSACPVCSARRISLPQTAKTAPWRGGRAALAQRVRPLLPAARAVVAGVAVTALVAGAFVAGRSNRPASAAGAAPTTQAGEASPGLPGGGFAGVSRDFGWSVLQGEVRLTLRRIMATGSTTRIAFDLSGLERDWTLAGVRGLHLEDPGGQELATKRLDRPIPVVDARDLGAGTVEVTVEIDRRIDPNSVARATVEQVLAYQASQERLDGTLVDANLKRLIDENPGSQVETSDTCQSCRLQVRCRDCGTIRLAGSTYRGGQVVLVLSQLGRFSEDETFGAADIEISSGASGPISSFESSAPGGDTVIQFAARDLADVTERGSSRMPFTVMATMSQGRVVNGPWRIDQESGRR